MKATLFALLVALLMVGCGKESQSTGSHDHFTDDDSFNFVNEDFDVDNWIKSTPSSVDTIFVGDSKILIPHPTGFTDGDEHEEMHLFKELTKSPSYSIWGTYIKSDDLYKSLDEVEFICSVKTLKTIEDKAMSKKDFNTAVLALETQTDRFEQKAKQILNKEVANLKENFSKAGGGDLKHEGSIAMPIHDRGSNYVSLVAYNKFKDAETGQIEAEAITSSLVLLNRRLIYLYVAGDEDSPEYAKKIMKDWVLRVLKANR